MIYGIGKKPFKNDKLKKIYFCDINNYSDLETVLNEINPDIIINLASIVTGSREYETFIDMVNVNLNALYNFYNILSKNNRNFSLFVNFGSTEEYGDYSGIPCEEIFWEKSTSPYTVTKTAGSRFIYMVASNESFPAITVRPSMLFGEYQSDEKFIPYVINSLIEGKELELTDCNQKRDFLYIKRFCELLLSLIESKKYKYGEIYNISSGIQFSLREIVFYIQKKVGNYKSKVSFGKLHYRKNEVMDFPISNEKLRRIINFKIRKSDILNDLSNYIENITS